MEDGLIERLKAGEGIGPVLGSLLEVVEQAAMGGLAACGVLAPELAPEVLADQRVGVEGARFGCDQAAVDQPRDAQGPLPFA